MARYAIGQKRLVGAMIPVPPQNGCPSSALQVSLRPKALQTREGFFDGNHDNLDRRTPTAGRGTSGSGCERRGSRAAIAAKARSVKGGASLQQEENVGPCIRRWGPLDGTVAKATRQQSFRLRDCNIPLSLLLSQVQHDARTGDLIDASCGICWNQVSPSNSMLVSLCF